MSQFLNGPLMRERAAEDAAKKREAERRAIEAADRNRKTTPLSEARKGGLKPGATYTLK